jgi:Domain of unknown function (DUF397)
MRQAGVGLGAGNVRMLLELYGVTGPERDGRDSEEPDGARLVVSPEAWRVFVRSLRK